VARTSLSSPDESLAGMARVGAPRQPMRTVNAHADNVSGSPVVGKSVRRKNTQAGNPTGQQTANHRTQKMAEKMGAQYGISAWVKPPVSPEAGATMMNARLMPTVIHRSKPNFQSAVSDAVGR
jgi:hypothetical protein